jgi:hypothetical protein
MDEETKQLTPEDPATPADLETLIQLDEALLDIAGRLADLELERVSVLNAYKRTRDQKLRFICQILVDRGLPPDSPVLIDSKTGILKLQERPE